jgi:hypothetical protein
VISRALHLNVFNQPVKNHKNHFFNKTFRGALQACFAAEKRK